MANRTTRGTSLRNPLAALARANEAAAATETRPQFRQQAKAEALRLRRLAQRQPDLRGPMLRREKTSTPSSTTR